MSEFPTDIRDAWRSPAGALMIIDTRGYPWEYIPGKLPYGPATIDAVSLVNERITVLDGDGAFWTYLIPQNKWAKGFSLADRPAQADDATAPWKKYLGVRQFKPGCEENVGLP